MTKNGKSVLLIIITILFYGCPNPNPPSHLEKIDGLIIKDGLYYKKGEDKPFSDHRYEVRNEEGVRKNYRLIHGEIVEQETLDEKNKERKTNKYYENGNLESEHYINFANIPKGYYKHYYENGNLKYSKDIRSIAIEGKSETFHINGKKESSVTCRRSYKNGVELRWDSIGNEMPSIIYYYGRTDSAIVNGISELIKNKQERIFGDCCISGTNQCFKQQLSFLNNEGMTLLFDFNQNDAQIFLLSLSLNSWFSGNQADKKEWEAMKSKVIKTSYLKDNDCGNKWGNQGEEMIVTATLKELERTSERRIEDIEGSVKLKTGKSRGMTGIDFEEEPFGFDK